RVHASGYILVLASLAASFASADESDGLLSVPDEAAQKQTVQLIANLYKGEYDAAKTPEQQSELAKKLFRVGVESMDDVSGRYVLFRLARDIAAGAGDAET